MTKELVVSANRHETKLAILEDEQLVEIYFQSANEYSLVGSIHKGRVTRVLPGMQSAFVNIGLERDAFLYVSDFADEAGEDIDRVSPADQQRGRGRDQGRDQGRDRGPVPPRSSIPPPPVAIVAAVAPVDGTSEAGPATAPNDGRGDFRGDGRGGDRGGDRGRRSRRRGRGNRGGFPDSKYASPDGGAAPAGESSRPERVEEGRTDFEPSVEAELEPLILPGESIAKYTLPGESIAKYSRPEPDAERAAEDAEDAAWAGQNNPDPEPEPEPIHVPEPERIPYSLTPPPLPPPLPVAEEIAAAIQESEDDSEPEDEPLVMTAGSSNVVTIPEDESPTMAVLEDDIAEQIQEALAEAAEAEAEAEAQADAEAEDALDDDGAPAEPATAADGQPLSAEVREQPQGRYLQRGNRRRRGRGGRDRNGERGERPPFAPAAAGAAAPPAENGEQPAAAAPAARSTYVQRPDRAPMPSISDLLKEGQEILVQIAKEPLGQKGARITSHIAMPGRYVVFMPTLEHLGVSRKVENDEERHRLKKIVQNQHAGMTGGFICRTAGEGKTEAEIGADMRFLYDQWLDIRKKAEKRNAPALLHHDLELVTRTLRDQVSDTFKAIWVDNEEVYENILHFLERFQPAIVNRVKLYTRPEPIFETFNITAELEKALRPKVWLKSGGYIVINQTEALVAIDINTGKFVGKSNRLEDTIVKTNTEAIKEIVRQVRLRDLGGIIVVDFIDMDERKNRHKVMQALEEAMRSDRAPYKILQFNDFGLVAITRRRVKQSLERALCEPCPTCVGAGYVKSVNTVAGEILTEARKMTKVLEGKDVMLRVNPEVAKHLKSPARDYIAELEEILGRILVVKSDPMLHPEQFDLV